MAINDRIPLLSQAPSAQPVTNALLSFDQNRQQRQRNELLNEQTGIEMDQQRRLGVVQQLAADAQNVQNLMEGGNVQEAVNLVKDRIDTVESQGGNARQLKQFQSQLQSGDREAVNRSIQNVMNMATRMGVVEQPARQDRLSASDLVPVQTEQGTRYAPAGMAVGREVPQDRSNTTQTEREIAALMERGIPREQAEDIAFGNVTTETDQFGNVFTVNRATGQVSRLDNMAPAQTGQQQPTQGRSQQADQGQQQERGDVFDAVESGTGPAAATKSFLNATIGPFVEGSLSPETTKSKSRIRNFNQEAKTALVNNPRFPVAEQKIVQDLLPNPDKFFTDPDDERQRLMELRRFLQNKRQANMQSMRSGQITQKELGILSNQNAALDRVLGLMGDPQGMNFTQMEDQRLKEMANSDLSGLSNEQLQQLEQELEQRGL